MKLYIVDIEPIEKRYTKQWNQWIPEMIKEYDSSIEFEFISGNPYTFKEGQFLDINATNIYKSEQIISIATLFNEHKIKENDAFLFLDSWHYGVSALKYMSQLQDINVKIFGIWHAGSYDPYDFLAMKGLQSWAEDLENSWFNLLDGVFVATHFHKQLILSKRKCNENKIHVTGLPFKFDYVSKYDCTHKENIIVFPHRVTPEKQPDVFDKLALKFPDYKFIKTTEVTSTKDEYYQLLAKSKICFSANLQETWGIGTFEAMSLMNCVIVPDRLSYTEMYDNIFKYSNEGFKLVEEFKSVEYKIIDMIKNYETYIPSIKDNFEYIKQHFTEKSMNNILDYIFSKKEEYPF